MHQRAGTCVLTLLGIWARRRRVLAPSIRPGAFPSLQSSLRAVHAAETKVSKAGHDTLPVGSAPVIVATVRAVHELPLGGGDERRDVRTRLLRRARLQQSVT